MFSKVFKVEKKSRELNTNQQRPSSTNEQRPTYYPLLQSSLHGQKKRATVHDTRAPSIEQDLDLLELVCRSDSLHKRLDELQAKYERMDDGMEHISRETHIKESKSEKRRQKSGLFSSTRISKSFEEPEVKKPSFFKRIFGNRLSKSEDDLIDKGIPDSSQDIQENGRDATKENGPEVIIPTPPLKDRRSASADILSTKDLVSRPPDKRHSCSVEFADLRDDMDGGVMPPPPPPPPALGEFPGSKGGLKRKRVIRVYNLNPLDQKNAVMGSSESCYDSTDSELDGNRTRRASESHHRSNHIYAVPANESQHYHHHHHHPIQHEGDACAYAHFDLVNGSGRSSRTSYRQTPLVNIAGGKMAQEGEWPRNEGKVSDSEGEWYGRDGGGERGNQEGECHTKDGGMTREGQWPISEGGRTMIREGEWRQKADSWSAGEGERTTKEGVLITREGGDLSVKEGEGGGLVAREGSGRKYDTHAFTTRRNPRSVESRGTTTTSHIESRSDGGSKRAGGVFTEDMLNPYEIWDSSPSDGEMTKDGTVRRRHGHGKKPLGLSKSADALALVPAAGSQTQTPSPKGGSTPMDTSDAEKQQESSDFAESSDTDIPLSKTSSSQDLPARLPTTASIQELDHFLSAIIHNLETQLQSGSSISIKPRQGDGGTEAIKRRRKKRKEEAGEAKVAQPGQPLPLRTKKMSECGACGRRWVEPRLLPCLHTVCTPCLHARAAHVPTNTATTSGTYPTPPQPYDGKITHPQSSPIDNNRPPSQERVLLPPVTVIPPTPNHSPSTPSPNNTSPPCPSGSSSNPSPVTITSTITYNGGNLNRHWNGDATHLSLTSVSSSSASNNNNNNTPTSQSNQQLINGNQTSQQSTQQQQQHQKHQQQQQHHHDCDDTQHQLAAASDDLDSVIELLTNLSPNISHNNTSNTPTPKLAVTPTPTPAPTSTPVDPPSHPPPLTGASLENELTSPSSTLDSRCSSRTRSSGRSSSSESANRNKGVWVVWCPECGFEAQVPSGGVECFPLNYILQKQLVLEALNSSSTTVFCDLCHDDVVAEERCDTCPVNLCRLCSRAHTRQRRTTHHNVISLQEARSMGIREVAHTLVCATHGEGEVGWWCRGCQEPLCASCLATLHRGHPTVTVDQEAPHARNNLTSMLELASSRMGELLSTVEDLTGAAVRVQQRGRAVNDQVNSFIDDYIMALEEHRHTLLRQIRQACEHAQRGIVTESQRAGQTASWLRQGCDLTHDLLHHAGDAEALALAPVVTLRLQHLLNEEVRGWARWERLALLRDHRAGKVRGHRLHGVIADTPAHPPSSRLKLLGDGNNLIAGSRVSALVVARDVDGQPITHGGEDVSATVVAKDGNILCSCSVRDREDGSYEVTFSPPLPTAAILKVIIQGAHVQGSPLEIMVTSASSSGQLSITGGDGSSKDRSVTVSGRQHAGIFHCCTFCSSGGDKTATCACGATMPGGYHGCGHNHSGHPGKKHWSCCAQISPTAPCTRPPSQYYQVTL